MTKSRSLLAIMTALALAGAASAPAGAATIPGATLNPTTGTVVADVLPDGVPATSCVVTYGRTNPASTSLAGTFDPAGDCSATIPDAPLAAGHWIVTVTLSDTATPANKAQSTFDFWVPSGARPDAPITGTELITPTGPATPPAILPIPPSRVDANATLLACAKSAIAITDISQRSGRVRILGVTKPQNAGRQIRIAFANAANFVATAIVAADGSFRATAPLPARSVRNTDRARYRATLDGQRTPWLKLTRRLVLSGLHLLESDLDIGGRLTGLLVKGARIVVTSQSSCGSPPKVIGHITVDSDGTFSRVIALPETVTGFVVRLTAVVRSANGNRSTTYSVARPIQVR